MTVRRLRRGHCAAGALPASGVRVLDLTRVIAGPVGTRYLGALGADVLRIDPPRDARSCRCRSPTASPGKRLVERDLRAEPLRAEELDALRRRRPRLPARARSTRSGLGATRSRSATRT